MRLDYIPPCITGEERRPCLRPLEKKDEMKRLTNLEKEGRER